MKYILLVAFKILKHIKKGKILFICYYLQKCIGHEKLRQLSVKRGSRAYYRNMMRRNFYGGLAEVV